MPLAAVQGQVRGAAQIALLKARLAALRLDTRAANRALTEYVAARDPDLRRQAIASTIRANIDFAAGDYARSALSLEAWLRVPEQFRQRGDATGNAETLAVARLLASEPRQSLDGKAFGTTPTLRDRAGLVRASATINGLVQEAVLDTGANLSVVSASTAKRLGLRILDGAATVGNSTNEHLATKVAIADRLTIAGATLSHVAFLVLDDAQLAFPIEGGYRIDAIIGFPVFRALARVRFDRSGGIATGTAAGPSENTDNLRAEGSDLYVLARVNGIQTALHLDTGATTSSLTSRFAKLHASLVAGLEVASTQVMGAGAKAITRRTAAWKPAAISIGGRTIEFPQIEVSLDPPAGAQERRSGVIGQDVLSGFQSYVVDFDSMSIDLGAPLTDVRSDSATTGRGATAQKDVP